MLVKSSDAGLHEYVKSTTKKMVIYTVIHQHFLGGAEYLQTNSLQGEKPTS